MVGERTFQGKRAVYRLASARFLSALGTSLASIALALEVYARTDSVVWLSFSFLFTFGIAGALGPIGGKLADRFDRKWVMVISDLASAGVWLFMATREGTVWLIGLGFVAHAIAQPFRAASTAAIPAVAGDEHIDWANSLMSVSWTSAELIGLGIGAIVGGLIGFGGACLINALSFVVSASIVIGMRISFQEDADGERGAGSIWKGFAVLWADPALRSLFAVWTVLYLTIDIALVGDIPLSRSMGMDPDAGARLLMFAWVLGAFAAGAVASRWMNERREVPSIVWGTAGIGLGYGIVALAPTFWIAMIGQFVASFVTIVNEVGGLGYIQRRTEDDVRGRVFAAVGSAGMMANAVGFSFAGFLALAVGPRWLYAIAGLASVALVPFLKPLREAGRVGTTPTVPQPTTAES